MKRRLFFALSLLFALAWVFKAQSNAQFADRAVITGVVTDASGAAVPDARVTITDEHTGVKTIVGTNGAGNYSTPPLILGTYRVEIEKQGFKVFSSAGNSLTGAQTVRIDAKLDIGATTETVKVEASTTELVNTENATVQHTVGEEYYHDLPAVMGADIRLAGVPAAASARLRAHAAQRRCHFPRKPVHLSHERRPDDGYRELV